MDDGVAGPAMTEIAPALVSTGRNAGSTEESGAAFSSLRLSAPRRDSDRPVMTGDDRLVLVGGDRYFDRDGRSVDPSTIDPDIPLDDLLRIRSAVSGWDVRLTPFDPDWRTRIRLLSRKSPISKYPETVR